MHGKSRSRSSSRGRSQYRTPSKTPKKRLRRSSSSSSGRVMSAESYRKWRASIGKPLRELRLDYGLPKPNGSDSIIVKQLRKTGRSLVNKKKVRIAKLGTPMKNAIKKIAAGSKIMPKAVYISRAIYWVNNPPPDNGQIVHFLQVLGANGTSDGNPDVLFSPTDFLHAASVAYNFKADTNIRTYTQTDNFDYRIFKTHLFNSYAVVTIKNNTQFEYSIKFIEFEYKSNCTYTASAMWTKVLTDANSANATNVGSNNSYGQVPDTWQAMKDYCVMTTKQFSLNPGETKIMMVQGFKNIDFDYQKFLSNNVPASTTPAVAAVPFFSIARGSKSVALVYENPLTGSTAAGGMVPGRFTNSTYGSTNRTGLFYEVKQHYRFGMPEQAGFEYPASTAAGVNQILSNRINKFLQYDYAVAQLGNDSMNIDQRNPAAPETTAGG